MNFHYAGHGSFGFAGKMDHPKVSSAEAPLKALFAALDHRLEKVQFRLWNGLANGSDRLAAKVFWELFVGREDKAHRAMGALLPFAKETYGSSVGYEQFGELYDRCDQRLELDGCYAADTVKGYQRIRNLGYQQQGKVMAKICDMLIAVAIKTDEQKPGGTLETVLSTLALKKPVLFFDLQQEQFYIFQSIEDWFTMDLEPYTAEAAVGELFKDIPELKQPEEEEERPEGRVYRLRRYVWRLYEAVFKGRKTDETRWQGIKKVFGILGELIRKKKVAGAAARAKEFSALHTLLEEKKSLLDEPANYYQYHYRGGYILNYLLALTAIFLAVVSIVILMERKLLEKWFEGWAVTVAVLVLGFIKLAILILLVKNTGKINHNKYNKKAIDYRYAAERLRINAFIALLGVLRCPKPVLGGHSSKHFDAYAGEEMYQAVMKELFEQGFTLVFNKDFLMGFILVIRQEWVGGQLSYHLNEAERMKRMDKRLENLPKVLSVTVLIVVIVDLLIGLVIELPELKLPGNWSETILSVVPVFLGLTALIPALVTTLNSVRFQADTYRLAERSENMVNELRALDKEMEKLSERLSGDDEGSNFFEVYSTAESIAVLMTDEVAEWSLIYEKRLFELG